MLNTELLLGNWRGLTQFDDESYHTLMKEVQSVVNSHPLAVNSWSSTEVPDALTPKHLLTMKAEVLMPPPGVFQREDLYLQKRWRRVQHLLTSFGFAGSVSFYNCCKYKETFKWTTLCF